MEYYDEYVSLGGNCEIGFQFRRYGKEPSSLFTWLVSDIDRIIKVLSNDFKDFYEFEDLVPYTQNMVKSKSHNLAFHTKMLSKKSEKTKIMSFIDDRKSRKQYHLNEQSKYEYLINKWNNLALSSSKVVYFIKDQNYTQEKVLELESFLRKKYPLHIFKLVWIKEGKEFCKEIISDFVDCVYVRLFSDIHYSWASDLESWNKIFDCYPVQSIPLVLNQEVNERTLNHLKNFNTRTNYGIRINFNIAQFFEELGFLDTAKYFITLAKEQSSKKFIEDEYYRITRKIENKRLEEEHQLNQHLESIYAIDNEKDMKSYFVKHDLLAWKYDNKPLEIKVNREARYIRLSLQEKICFHLDEVEVYNLKNENIALNKSLMMSSTYKQEKPLLNQKALNGKVTGKPSFHTKTESNPWVLLDLEDYEQVTYIKIFNRQGEYSTRALSILVEVSNDLKEWTLVFDNFKIFKKLNHDLLSSNQKDILENIKNSEDTKNAKEF